MTALTDVGRCSPLWAELFLTQKVLSFVSMEKLRFGQAVKQPCIYLSISGLYCRYNMALAT